MERYKIIQEVGVGTYGQVWRAENKQSGEIVAIKKLKTEYSSWEECLNLREVKSLRKMNHPNIVKLKEIIKENNVLFFVFEYMDCNLYQLMENRCKQFSEVEIRNWCFQVFQALAHMHQQGYFHRDLKPENLLVTKDIVKIADLGLAREISSGPPYTEYVTTRWYRAPEVLLHSSVYDPAVDTWAMGAIMAELFTFRPLFPGSSEVDQVYKICSVIGTPNRSSWAEGLHLADVLNYQFPQFPAVHLSVLIPMASEDAINLIRSLCSWDPRKRPNAAEALRHSFFQSCYYIPRPFWLPKNTTPVAMRSETLELNTNMNDSAGAYYSGAQRMLGMDYYTICHAPAINNTGYPAGRIEEEVEKLSQLTLGSRTGFEARGEAHHNLSMSSAPMKAESWLGGYNTLQLHGTNFCCSCRHHCLG